ncbi:hypothetical protein C5E07_06640 [Pseudoclavibacter sp. RFBJ3]|uniref:hypothetical protein n=1 Tax=unclassified Pseudoclavibacter TaxID=2615177 RepID=UPI000CE7D3F5|nr:MULTISPECIES: hypothetical protein [unclassified Pseudoclavibacter]MBF4551843.1 hypothetical protein [Pseudoclavibacter sp. VKM Ac-2888]PPF37485.1 hypothetical protein C5E05_07045 [Pseudoclavibacter sp. AY1H1]PPF76906.1 hypothetical protein C5B99_05255 [Pseudoclavibacter sp. Z016]PPF85435.1 hypothetical protein C5C12_04135 [Pseudoclavibacter sp. RFBJ5]PPF93171.1 hypothetical protein C5E07_06640 [Pseudoclavibacter sp. RFBJ3]
MNVPVKLSLYAALLAAVFGAAFFTAQLAVDAGPADDWRPQIHQTPDEQSEAPEHGEGER